MPDSGRLIHLRTPRISADIRVDAGFIEGDEISSHYDPMIAKLIVHGSDRLEALRKLRAALAEYEVAGPATNIEFLKKLCAHPDFLEGKVETGFIQSNQAQLFTRQPIPAEVWVQAAISILKQEACDQEGAYTLGPEGSTLGFGSQYQTREFHLLERGIEHSKKRPMTRVVVDQTSADSFDVVVDNSKFRGIKARLVAHTALESFFPLTRLLTTVVRDADRLTVFQHGTQYNLQCVLPTWTEKVLGIKDVANSVIAPMPCKVLRVDVREGDEVRKDQPLVVIESMKMETVIRSPQDAIVSKVVHTQGVRMLHCRNCIEFADCQ